MEGAQGFNLCLLAPQVYELLAIRSILSYVPIVLHNCGSHCMCDSLLESVIFMDVFVRDVGEKA